MTPRELAQKTNWKDVRRAFHYWYPHMKNIDVLEGVLERVKQTKKRAVKGWKLEIRFISDWVSDGKGGIKESWEGGYVDMNRSKEGDDTHWSCSFEKWNILINTEIAEINFPIPDVIAHFLYELTWHGNEEETERKGKEMKKMFKDAKKQIEQIEKK
jgi:hypothetical protein